MSTDPKTQINIGEIKALHKRLSEINALSLPEIEFLDENNQVVTIDPKILKTWLFIGLNITDFIVYDYYLNSDLRDIQH